MTLILFLVLISSMGLLSFSLTWLIKNFAVQKKLVAIPNERSLHDVPTPHGGGIAIISTWYIGLTILFFSGVVEKTLYFALSCGILLAVVSLINDLIGLTPWFRLVIQFITSIAAFYFMGGLRPLVLPGINPNLFIFIYPLAIIGMVWFINLFNFMDGVDGFSSVEAIIICSALFIFTWNVTTILLIACTTGFLYWNWPKAKIFMGDVGSTQLGFILVVLGIYFHNNLEFSILNWIMLSSPFWFDATLTLFRRWRNGEKLGEAHRKHAYQRIVQAGFSHLKVNIYLLIINLFVVVIILIYREFKFLQVPLFILTLTFFYLLTKYVDRRVPFRKE